jgi:hypothetical protein
MTAIMLYKGRGEKKVNNIAAPRQPWPLQGTTFVIANRYKQTYNHEITRIVFLTQSYKNSIKALSTV